ncbi:mechanosensitive ion channel family protein [uncultured Deefgea sp.]|uniref:mechanosensitive ion channel family protein n=1 Tax=uncultured Deefgea sp. TaxID=1304914 RepID=UPI0026270722|nr:mechanosensitive ion channel family protein [uncultured Deefgea sp.]
MNHYLSALNFNQEESLFQLLFHDAIIFCFRLFLFALIIFAGSYLVKKVDKYFSKVYILNTDENTKQFSRSMTKLGLYIAFFLLGLLAFGFSERSIATMISAIGLGIGISLKEFLSNFAGGVVLFFSRPFVIGDFIKVNGVMGNVTQIEIFSTHINSLDGRRIIIPNNVMISGNIVNYDTNPIRRIKITVSVAYDSDMKKVLQILENIARSYPGLDQNQAPFIHVMSYGDSSINILFMVWTDRDNYYQVRGELMAFLIAKLSQEGVDIPFNILDVSITDKSIGTQSIPN